MFVKLSIIKVLNTIINKPNVFKKLKNILCKIQLMQKFSVEAYKKMNICNKNRIREFNFLCE